MRRTFVLTAIAGGTLAAVLAGTGAVATASEDATTASGTTQACVEDCTGTGEAFGLGSGNRYGNGPGEEETTQGRGRPASSGQTRERGNGRGGRGAGTGQANQAEAHSDLPASGTLSEDQKRDLLYMVEEEKLAHDVYVALGEATGDARFERIAASESRHTDAVRTLLDRYGMADPTAGQAEGEFVNPDLQALYDALVAQGKGSLDAALEVGRTVETTDIADLEEALSGLTAADVTQVYESLLAGSQNHLRAFGG